MTKMRCTFIFLLSVLSLTCAAPPRSQKEILSQFFRYAETIRGIQIHNMLVVTVNFVQQIVDSVPVEERGPGTSVLESYINRGKNLRQHGSTAEKYVYVYDLQGVFEGLKDSLSQSAPESKTIGMSLIGLLGVASEFAKEDEKVHNKFTEGATQMKTKLTLATIAQESEVFNAINKYITSNDVQQHETLIEEVLRFKNKY
ncbi:uncharacterized protein LOC119546432 [Drosophila subpulchrella]|uniref:uncharacterized protein LOC119546432 n=1 Tax=Drosophila subpulchrella TaxID=1486046 RepID=UPI0018A19B0F|nr:uncharacterized protein LOC119546432 [Drosophila subpulchrella]